MHGNGRRVARIALALGIILLSAGRLASAQAQAANPFIGVWELDRFKSVYDPITTQPERRILTLEATATPGEFKSTTRTWRNSVAADVSYTAKFDGAEYPTGAPQTTVSFKRVNANTVERTAKLMGQVRETATWTVSPDGKMLTITTKGTDTENNPYSSTQIYAKQVGS
jgi:hypothetical protein